MLCERTSEVQLAACGTCPACRQVRAGNHPDVILIQKPADKAFIPVELFIGDAEHRMRAGLCSQIRLKPFSGRRKIAIIDDADYLNKEGSNSLLKTLEEPPPKSLLILIGTSEQRQLPTIRPRCQVIRFGPLAEQDVAELLIEKGLCENRAAAAKAAASSQGTIEKGGSGWIPPHRNSGRAIGIAIRQRAQPSRGEQIGRPICRCRRQGIRGERQRCGTSCRWLPSFIERLDPAPYERIVSRRGTCCGRIACGFMDGGGLRRGGVSGDL